MIEKDPIILSSVDFSAILGVHTWNSKQDIFRRIVLKEVKEPGELLTRGLFMETSHRDMAEHNLKRGGYDVYLKKAKTIFWETEGVPFRLTGDFMAVPTSRHRKPLFGVELKQAHGQQRSTWGAVMSDDVPEMYKIQCVMQCEKYNVPFVILDADFSNFSLPTPFLINRDEEYAKHIEAEAVKFWKEHIETGIMPPIDDSDACRKTLLERERWQEKRRDMDEQEVLVAGRIAAMEAELKRIGADLDTEKNTLLDSAGPYEELTYPVETDDGAVIKKTFCRFSADKNGKRSARFYPKGFST